MYNNKSHMSLLINESFTIVAVYSPGAIPGDARQKFSESENKAKLV